MTLGFHVLVSKGGCINSGRKKNDKLVKLIGWGVWGNMGPAFNLSDFKVWAWMFCGQSLKGSDFILFFFLEKKSFVMVKGENKPGF